MVSSTKRALDFSLRPSPFLQYQNEACYVCICVQSKEKFEVGGEGRCRGEMQRGEMQRGDAEGRDAEGRDTEGRCRGERCIER